MGQLSQNEKQISTDYSWLFQSSTWGKCIRKTCDFHILIFDFWVATMMSKWKMCRCYAAPCLWRRNNSKSVGIIGTKALCLASISPQVATSQAAGMEAPSADLCIHHFQFPHLHCTHLIPAFSVSFNWAANYEAVRINNRLKACRPRAVAAFSVDISTPHGKQEQEGFCLINSILSFMHAKYCSLSGLQSAWAQPLKPLSAFLAMKGRYSTFVNSAIYYLIWTHLESGLFCCYKP